MGPIVHPPEAPKGAAVRGPHRDGSEALAAVVGAAVDALHGAGCREHVGHQEPVAAKLVHDRAQQPLLLRAPRYRLPAARSPAAAPADLCRAKFSNQDGHGLAWVQPVRLLMLASAKVERVIQGCGDGFQSDLISISAMRSTGQAQISGCFFAEGRTW